MIRRDGAAGRASSNRLVGLCLALALAVACSAEPTPTPTPTIVATPEAVEVAPLTGVPGAPPKDRPIVAVKIDNSPNARPQSGLELADVVFEEIVEGGVTRLLVLFNSQIPEVIGPIRSGRLVDVSVLPAYSPVLVLSGARNEVLGAIKAAGIKTISEDGPGSSFFRDKSRRSPHNLYADGPKLFEVAADLGVGARSVWTFAAEPPAGAVACAEDEADCGTSITVRMTTTNTTGFEYDQDESVYRRSQNGAPFLVIGAGSIGAANVVVLAMTVGPKGCCDSAGNPFTHTDVVDSGRAVVLRDGQRYDVTWNKDGVTSHIELLLGEEPFALAPGPTWVLLAPKANVP